MAMIAMTIAAVSGSVSTPDTNERSIFSSSSGKPFRQLSEE
jgi:hypothetical protein